MSGNPKHDWKIRDEKKKSGMLGFKKTNYTSKVDIYEEDQKLSKAL